MTVEPTPDATTPPPIPDEPPLPTDPGPPVLIQVQAQVSDGLVIAMGYFPAGVSDASTVIVDVTDPAEAAKLHEPGAKHINFQTGVITVTPPPPPPLRYEHAINVSATVRTTNDTPTEIFRVACQQNRQYTAMLIFMGVNPANWATKSTGMRYSFKRQAAAPAIVGEAPVFNIDEQGSASWNVAVAIVGTDFVIRVIGGRTTTTDWLVTGDVQVYVPAGF